MATNSELTSEAGLVELLGRERYDDYFNEAVGGDSTCIYNGRWRHFRQRGHLRQRMRYALSGQFNSGCLRT